MSRITVGVLALAAMMAGPAAGGPGMAHEGQAADGKARPAAAPVDLNTATLAQLEALPGIGPRTAERIVEYRQQNGGFRKVEELMNVRGVGEASFLKLRPLIIVTPPKAERSKGSSPGALR